MFKGVYDIRPGAGRLVLDAHGCLSEERSSEVKLKTNASPPKNLNNTPDKNNLKCTKYARSVRSSLTVYKPLSKSSIFLYRKTFARDVEESKTRTQTEHRREDDSPNSYGR